MKITTLPQGRPRFFEGSEDRGVKTKLSWNLNVSYLSWRRLSLRNGNETREEGCSLQAWWGNVLEFVVGNRLLEVG